MCKTHFSTGAESVAMVTAYYGKNGKKILRRELLPQFFYQFSWNLAQMSVLGCRCARHIFFDSGRKCCHGNGILWQKWGKNLASQTTSSLFHQFSWNLAQMSALGCKCARHIFFYSGRKCVAMVMAYYGKNGGGGGESCVVNYFLRFSPILMKFGTHVCLGV